MARKVSWFKRLRKRAEVGLARAGRVLLTPLPRGAILLLARVLGSAGYWCSGQLRAIGRANLDLVYGDQLSSAAKTRILKQSCRTFALVALDSIWFSARTVERTKRWVSFEKPLVEVFGNGKAAVCLTGHLGNWEVLGHAASVAGFPLASVATPLKNPAVDEFLRRARETTGQTIIERTGAVRAMLQALRRGGRVALLLDQNTQINEGGIFVDFFGLPATVSAAGASLAYRTGTDIFFGFCIPQPDGSYRVRIPRSITPPPYDRKHVDEAVRKVTQEICSVYEDEIRACPECWLWMYKRWKHVRPGDARNRYPFYSSELDAHLIPPSYRYENSGH